jgi:hypothetical protein
VILGNSQVSQLRSKVVETLGKTLLPSLRDVKTDFNCLVGPKKNISPVLTSKNVQAGKANEIYRNQLYTEFFIIDKV